MIMLYDGVCNVCNASVQFVLAHERAAEMQFASLQSERGQKIVAERSLSGSIDSVVVIDGERVYRRSGAVVFVLGRTRAPWRWLAPLLWLVPRPLRDLGYDLFAKNRYRMFGKRDACMIPTPELRARFLDA